jgi:NADPH:quinone reductase-like Zn-dependent oxidoreductase
MRAFVLTRYGGPEHTALTDMPRPSPQAGELLGRVHAAGLNPVDFKTRAGALKVIHRYPLPIVMGNELSGVVETVGPGGDPLCKERRRVRAWIRPSWAPSPSTPWCEKITQHGCRRRWTSHERHPCR